GAAAPLQAARGVAPRIARSAPARGIDCFIPRVSPAQLWALLHASLCMIAFMGARGAHFSGSTSEAALTQGAARNPVDHNRDRIRQGLRYRAQSNRLEVGRFIAHLIRASRADAVSCLIAPRMDNGQR